MAEQSSPNFQLDGSRITTIRQASTGRIYYNSEESAAVAARDQHQQMLYDDVPQAQNRRRCAMDADMAAHTVNDFTHYEQDTFHNYEAAISSVKTPSTSHDNPQYSGKGAEVGNNYQNFSCIQIGVLTAPDFKGQFSCPSPISTCTTVPTYHAINDNATDHYFTSYDIASVDIESWVDGFLAELIGIEDEDDFEDNENEVLERQWNMFAAYTEREERGLLLR
ncbi:hypothetical protein RUND412_002302 [Rhizina undulata]